MVNRAYIQVQLTAWKVSESSSQRRSIRIHILKNFWEMIMMKIEFPLEKLTWIDFLYRMAMTPRRQIIVDKCRHNDAIVSQVQISSTHSRKELCFCHVINKYRLRKCVRRCSRRALWLSKDQAETKVANQQLHRKLQLTFGGKVKFHWTCMPW